MPIVDSFRVGLRGLFSAPRCLLCAGTASGLICEGCRRDLPWNRIACPGCALPLGAGPAHRCRNCTADPPPFDSALAAFRYAAPVDRAIQSLKYNADFLAARWLGEALAQTVAASPTLLPQVLLPVPLHPARLRRRGFNQALELARQTARALDVRVESKWLQRTRPTADQIGLTAIERRRNVKGAFTVDVRVKGVHIALIDDVMTTGSTVREIARACRKAGAARVQVWTAARKP